MTLRELCERRNNMNNTTEEERTGLGILEFYVDKLENAKEYKTMAYASDTINGFLLGLRMTEYINKKEYEALRKNKESYENDFFDRTREE